MITTLTQQPETIRLADALKRRTPFLDGSSTIDHAEKELRRQHAEIASLTAENEALTAENEAVHDAVADASTPSSAPRGGKFIPTAINMKLFKEGDKSKAICSFCKDVVSTTFKHRDVPFSDGIGVAKNILVSVCDCCGQVVATPPQSTPAIRLSRDKT